MLFSFRSSPAAGRRARSTLHNLQASRQPTQASLHKPCSRRNRPGLCAPGPGLSAGSSATPPPPRR
jgi:hypothetical protein